jgi:hypothetical protein
MQSSRFRWSSHSVILVFGRDGDVRDGSKGEILAPSPSSPLLDSGLNSDIAEGPVRAMKRHGGCKSRNEKPPEGGLTNSSMIVDQAAINTGLLFRR